MSSKRNATVNAMINFGKRRIYVGVYAIITSIIIFFMTTEISVNNDGITSNRHKASLTWSISRKFNPRTWMSSIQIPQMVYQVWTKSEEMFTREPVMKSTVVIGIGIPKTGGNKMDTMISESFKLISCNRLWANLSLDSARASIYCASGKTIAHPDVKKDVLRRLGTECNYLGTHQDMSIGSQLQGLRVSYVTMLREPISRLVSGCNYILGKKCNYDTIVKFARSHRVYGMPNRMMKIIAGLDPMCSFHSNKTAFNDEAILDIAKTNIRDKFIFVGILERLNESIALLPSPVTNEVVLPRQASRGGTFKGEINKLTKLLAPYVNLDQRLYHYANQLFDAQLKKSGLSK